jgi:glycosyltransferase involved in cell wall biosynthesis
MISMIRNRKSGSDPDYLPTVSLIITVHNEKKRIESKIENTLALIYPKDRFEVIFASDFSTDGTDDIVRKYPRTVSGSSDPHKRGGRSMPRNAL